MNTVQLDENGNLVIIEVVPRNWDTPWIREQYKLQDKTQEWYDNLVSLEVKDLNISPEDEENNPKLASIKELDFTPREYKWDADMQLINELFTYDYVLFLASEHLDPKAFEDFKKQSNEKNYLHLALKFEIPLRYDH